MALPSMLMLVVAVGVQFITPHNPAAAGGPPDPQQIVRFVIWGGLAMFVGMVAYWITYAIALGASTVAVSQLYRSESITIAGAYAPIRGQATSIAVLLFLVGLRIGIAAFGSALVLTLLSFGLALLTPVLSVLAIAAGMLATVALVIWMSLRYSVAVPVVVLEDHTPSESIARSIELTGGNLGRVFVMLLFAVIVAYAAMFVFQGPFVVASMMAGPETTSGFWLTLGGVVAGSIASAFTGPLAIIAVAVLYYDLRVRKEGLDLQLMISDLGRPAPDAPAALPG
jgi:hypothetical protein